MKLSRLATDCLAYLASTGKSPHTLDAYHVTFRQFEQHDLKALKWTVDHQRRS